jgi:hypothetical protein
MVRRFVLDPTLGRQDRRDELHRQPIVARFASTSPGLTPTAGSSFPDGDIWPGGSGRIASPSAS